jgi:hypothetical protein
MSDNQHKPALTTEQIIKLSMAIADTVCCNVGGLSHYRNEVERWVYTELEGTPYESGQQPDDAPALAEVKPAADDRVVAYLRTLLERAEAGELLAVAIAGELTGREVITGVAGEHDMFRILGALDMMKSRIISGCRAP